MTDTHGIGRSRKPFKACRAEAFGRRRVAEYAAMRNSLHVAVPDVIFENFVTVVVALASSL
jgi:hypothetical protein